MEVLFIRVGHVDHLGRLLLLGFLRLAALLALHVDNLLHGLMVSDHQWLNGPTARLA